MDEKKSAEILGINDRDIQKYLKKHPEKAVELGQNLIELDKETERSKNLSTDLDPLNRSSRSYGGNIPESPVYFRGFFKTPLILAFISIIVLFIIFELIVFFVTGHF